MNNPSFDTTALFDTYRNAFAPMIHAQQEGLKALERFANYQYAVAGDYLNYSLAQAKAALAARNPGEFVARQSELSTKLSDQLRGRVQELTTLANETQNVISQLYTEATEKFADITKKAA